jgi:hypothetical protein
MPTFTKNLQKGSIGVEVFSLQNLLERMGYGDFTPTGYYGDKTVEYVKKYQKANNIEAVGTVGPITRNSLNTYIVNESSRILYKTALKYVGTDASPADTADDDVGCADTVSCLLRYAFGNTSGIPFTVSTNLMYQYLKYSKQWVKQDKPSTGCIVISPTGYGNGALSNGHVGVIGLEIRPGVWEILSNNSPTGTLEINYDTDRWRSRYVNIGGYPMDYYKKIS